MTAGFGNRRRQSLRDVFQGVLERAQQWPADAVLIAGDLFELERVTRDTVAFLKRALDAISPMPVFIAPGNHDPYVTRSPYAGGAWPGNVYIFDSPEWKSYEVADGRLNVHGFAFDGSDISSNPFGELRIDPGPGVTHIAVGHGSEMGHQPSGKELYAPFNAGDAAQDGLAYLALGHFHDVTHIEGDFDTVMYYCGAPEGHGFNETGPRHYLEVEIREDGGVAVQPRRSSNVVYRTHSLDCSGFTTAQEIIEAIRAIASDSDMPQVARIDFEGLCPPELQIDLAAIYDATGAEFECLHVRDYTEPAEDFDALADENTCLGLFVRKLNEEIEDAPDDDRRRLVRRARDVGLAAYRRHHMPIWGMEES